MQKEKRAKGEKNQRSVEEKFKNLLILILINLGILFHNYILFTFLGNFDTPLIPPEK